jgi:hypothetical protein
MSKRNRILFVFGGVAFMVFAYVWFLGVATMFALEARYVGWKMPIVKSTPRDLPDLAVSSKPVQKLSYFGYEFEVPWEVDEAKSRQAGKMQIIAFRSGNVLLFSKMAPKEFVNTFLSSAKVDPEELQQLYGEHALASDYALHRLILEATPTKVGLLTPRKQAVGGAMLLVIKGVIVPKSGESGIFRVRTKEFQGFQYGDPQQRPKSVDVEIFADDGGFGLVFAVPQKEPVPTISQVDINRIIQSLRKIPIQR